MRNFRGCWWAASLSNGFGSQQHCKSWLYMGYLDIIRNICSICKYLYPDKGVQAPRYLWELSTWPFPDNVGGSKVTSHKWHNGQGLVNFGCYFACCCTIHLLLVQFPCHSAGCGLCLAELGVGFCWHQYERSLNIAEKGLGIDCRAVIRAGRHGSKHWKCLPFLPCAAELFLNSLSQPYSLEEQEQMLSCLSIDSPFVSDASEKVSGDGWEWLAGPSGTCDRWKSGVSHLCCCFWVPSLLGSSLGRKLCSCPEGVEGYSWALAPCPAWILSSRGSPVLCPRQKLQACGDGKSQQPQPCLCRRRELGEQWWKEEMHQTAVQGLPGHGHQWEI